MLPYRVWGGSKLPRPTNGNTEKGFTLVEVMVSLAAMAIGFVILWGMHFASLRMQSSDQTRAEALRVANAALEWQRNHNGTYPGSNATSNIACPSTVFASLDLTRLDGGACQIQYNWPTSWRKEVTATVSWRERINMVGGGGPANKRTQSVQLTTIYIDH
jgi:prepilin-type N-terminal cleavage/methylation domain-containing protein